MDLGTFQPEKFGCWLLQYVDDLLLAAENKDDCWEGTKASLRLLMEAGYPVSKKKGSDLQGGGEVFGICSKEGHKAVEPVQRHASICDGRAPMAGITSTEG